MTRRAVVPTGAWEAARCSERSSLPKSLWLTLLTGGALLLRVLRASAIGNLGFNPENVLVGVVNPPRTTYDTRPKYRAFYDQVLEKASAIPGVEEGGAHIRPFR